MTAESGIYQVSCTVTDCGRNIKKTKLCVVWKFGLVNKDIVATGATGRECCGEEHKVKLIWSLTSGKQRLFFDNDVVYNTKLGVGARQKGVFKFQWKTIGLDLVIKAYAAPPIRQQDDWKQFDLLIDGKCFDSYLKVFQLGTGTNSESAQLPDNTSSSQDVSPYQSEENVPSESENDDEDEQSTLHVSSGSESGSESDDEDEQSSSRVSSTSENDEDEQNISIESYQSFDFPAEFDKCLNLEDGDTNEIDENNDEEHNSARNSFLTSFDDESYSDEDDQNESTISTLLERKHMSMSDDLEKDDIQINPNEPPSLEALNKISSPAREVKVKSPPLSYGAVWGNVFDPFCLHEKGNSRSCKTPKEKKEKTMITTNLSPKSVIDKLSDKVVTRLKPYKQKSRLAPCVRSFTRRHIIKSISETAVYGRPRYKGMPSNDEPIF